MTIGKQRITDAELAVLRALWERGPLTARAIAESIYPQCGESEIGAVHSLLKRLEGKRLVQRDRRDRAHRFSAAVSQTEAAGSELEATARKLSGGSLAPLIMHLVENQRLTREEIDQLRRLLDEHGENPQ